MLKFHSEDRFDDSILLGYDTASIGKRILAFRGNVAGSSSSVEMSKVFGPPQKLQTRKTSVVIRITTSALPLIN